MKYKTVIEKAAVKFIKKQPVNQQKRIIEAISKLPEAGDIKSLKGYDNYFRLRVGDYRIIYTVKNDILTVIVTSIGNRGQIYKNKVS